MRSAITCWLTLALLTTVAATGAATPAHREVVELPSGQYLYLHAHTHPGEPSHSHRVDLYDETNGLPGLQTGFTCANGSSADYDHGASAWTCNDGSTPTPPDECKDLAPGPSNMGVGECRSSIIAS